MINRINLILRAKNITARQFAEEIGIQPSGMSHIMSGRNNPSLDFVTKVIRRYPEIDANWLIMGRGAMYGGNGSLPVVEDAAPADTVQHHDDIRQTEGTLFDVPVDDEPVAAVHEPGYEPTYIAVPPAEEQPSLQAVPDTPAKILFLYDDNTFRVLTPRR